MKILIATTNKRKTSEIVAILQGERTIPWQFSPMPKLSEPDEPYSSFIENACHKAKYYGGRLNMPALSEDTGLCVSALNQFPGIRTKDFIEENHTINNAIEALERKLQNTSDNTATFVCASALYIPALDIMLSHEARETGYLTFPARGEDGFGFDPVFVPHGYHQTIAELGSNIKNQHGHRAMAIKGLLHELHEVLRCHFL
jgi:XTP/dITP diphosphohydrolase